MMMMNDNDDADDHHDVDDNNDNAENNDIRSHVNNYK